MVSEKARGKRPIQVRWRRPLDWRLVRWQSHWAFLIPIPKPLGQMHLRVGAGALAISGTFTLLEMTQTGQKWIAHQSWQARWSVNFPLKGWRVIGYPQWLRREESWWLVVPVSR